MIKNIYLVEHTAESARQVTARRAAATAALSAPPDVRPVRVAVCAALPDVLPVPRFEAVVLEWFVDDAHQARFASWLASPEGAAAGEGLRATAMATAEAGQLVVAREHPMRGADWLERRWREGGTAVKHMAIARRAAGLSRDEFSELWRNRAGKVGATPIPAEARGNAYVQNHPLPTDGHDWPFDAVNEVYFDDLEGLRARIAWFAENFDGVGEDDLVAESWFVAVREEIL
ncbi:EthD domain-containing protein [Frankia sp. CNm7]|uniref:EthD domain-containing protein n=2 Tax=Frankia nepalensis TaxID=1836974 RepID=A0A937RWW4_9ACTN|nr:EthD domain-containing protein [Frankia nepalensis]MBL7510083.1 EthD domain-containing protein [Frankia nepalensis]MBL7521744.1 EthD domain-containing protein [Frankia nepalensis]MBL7633311.1 EthD domain-containing protein [Frankia nepalensis]